MPASARSALARAASTSPATLVTNTLSGVFDCAFDSNGDAYVSATAVPGTNEVFQVDVGSGGTDLILSFVGTRKGGGGAPTARPSPRP